MEQIWLYTLQQWSIEKAHAYIQLLMQQIEFLADNPMHGKDYSHVRAGFRRSAVQAHYIFYKISGPQVPIEIIRVLHKNMDVISKLKR